MSNVGSGGRAISQEAILVRTTMLKHYSYTLACRKNRARYGSHSSEYVSHDCNENDGQDDYISGMQVPGNVISWP
jgi:hypothetical protein